MDYVFFPHVLLIIGKESLQLGRGSIFPWEVEEIVDIIAHNHEVVLPGQIYYLLATLLGAHGGGGPEGEGGGRGRERRCRMGRKRGERGKEGRVLVPCAKQTSLRNFTRSGVTLCG